MNKPNDMQIWESQNDRGTHLNAYPVGHRPHAHETLLGSVSGEAASRIREALADDRKPFSPHMRSSAMVIAEEARELDLKPYEIEIRTMPPEIVEPVRELKAVVNRAVCDLEHQGARSSRIALQLLTALVKFEQETGI